MVQLDDREQNFDTVDLHEVQNDPINTLNLTRLSPVPEPNSSSTEEELTDEEQEQHFQQEIDYLESTGNLEPSLSTMAATGETHPEGSMFRRRFKNLAKHLPLQKSKKSDKPPVRRLKMFELYRFADKFDILLMVIGTVAALSTGALFPLMLLVYRQVTNHLVTLGKIRANATSGAIIEYSNGQCFVEASNFSADGSPEDAIQGLIKYYVILGFSSIFLYWVAWSTWLIAAERQTRRIRFKLFRNILRQEIGWFDLHNSGELSSRLIDDLGKIKDGIGDKVPDFVTLLARIIGAIIYALIVGWKLTLVFLSISPAVIISFNLTIRVIIRYTIKEVKAFAKGSAIAQEVLQSIRTVTAFHGQQKEELRFSSNLYETEKIGIRKGLLMGMCQGLMNVFIFGAFAVTFWYGPQLARDECEKYNAGTIIVVFMGCMIATFSTAQIIPNLQNFAEAAASGVFVFEMIDRKTMIDAFNDQGAKPNTVVGDIELKDVIFTYPARQDALILNHINLTIPSGKTVALVGASGCGKSTTIQLIQRFYDPDSGQILLDGQDIKNLNLAWLRSQIGVVSQEPVLFTGTIEENIRFGKPDATDEEVQQAAKMANAHDFIMELPENYKTSSGEKLSGGQKQRVAIARALISNPKILLLDEATSALDNASERVVQDALDKAKEGRTTIVIAHRLSTIRNADLIFVLDRGKVAESGSHDELMEQKSLYFELVTAQHEKQKHEEEDYQDEDQKENIFLNQDGRKLSNARRNSNFDNSHGSSGETGPKNILDGDNVDQSSVKKSFIKTPFLMKILRLNSPEWIWIVIGSLSSMMFGVMQPLFALFFSKIYALFAEPDLEEQERLINIYAGIIFLVGAIGGLTQFLTTYAFSKSGEALTTRMRNMTFSAMLRQEIGYFDQESNSVGALVTRLSSDASALKGLTGVRIGIILQALSAFVAALIIAFSAGWQLTLIILCFVPPMIMMGKIQGKKHAKAGQAKSKGSLSEQGSQHATQAIEQIRTVVALHREEFFINLYEDVFNQEFKKQMGRVHLIAIGSAVGNSVLFFIHSANFSFGASLVKRGSMEFDGVFRVFSVITFAILSIGRSMALVPDYAKAKKAAIRIMELTDRRSNIDPFDDSGITIRNLVGKIEFEHVDFRYPSRPTLRILRDFSLKCQSGNTTALVGPSGSGKSTTIALLQRFYDPIEGKVLLDGQDIRTLNLKWLRSSMGLVQQEPILFNISIRDNIAYGDNSREVTQQAIEDAARMANIHDTIISLPQGYETLCGAKGNQLSGGQKQRIAIARALIRSPKILLLDEATSALDNKSEQIVHEALDKARSGRTCLTIAHRLSTIRNSEKIAVVDRGKMREEGTHEQLLTLGGVYAKLASIQETRNYEEKKGLKKK